MIKVMLLLTRRQDMTWEEFEQYVRHTSLPMAAQLPGLRRLVVDWSRHDPHGVPPLYDAIVENWFDDPVAMGIAFTSPEGQAIAADAANFLERSRFDLFVIQEEEFSLSHDGEFPLPQEDELPLPRQDELSPPRQDERPLPHKDELPPPHEGEVQLPPPGPS